MIVLRNKNFSSKYDATDQIKQMKDSDILAEKEKHQDISQVATSTAGTALKGAAVGAGAAGAYGVLKGVKGTQGFMNKVAAGAKSGGKLAKTGAIIGGGLGAVKALANVNKTANDNAWYNTRLREAKAKSARRERKDWKNNVNNRDGYTY